MADSPYASPLYSFLTAAQVRDRVVIAGGVDPKEAKLEYLKEKQRRKDGVGYVECPRCRESHGDTTNYEGICHYCRLTMLDHFPHHGFTLAMEKAEGFNRK